MPVIPTLPPRWSFRAAAVLALLLAAGPGRAQWPTFQADEQHTGRASAVVNPANLTKVWSAPQGYGIPLVVGDTVYSMRLQESSTQSTTIRSFHLSDGAVNWTYTNQFANASRPTYSNGSLIFTAVAPNTSNVSLYSVSAATGALQYTVPLTNLIYDTSSMAVVHTDGAGNRTAYVTGYTGGSGIVAVNLGATSGNVLWYDRLQSFGGGVPTVVGNSVVVVGAGQYYAYDLATGARNIFHTSSLSGGGSATVVHDSARGRFYVAETYSTAVGLAVTAYDYTNNSTITQAWQLSGGVINGGSAVAVGPTGKLYFVANSTLKEVDPASGATLRSLGGQSFPTSATPVISDGYLWIYNGNTGQPKVSIYDLNTFTRVGDLFGGRGDLNTSFTGPGALADNYFVLDYGPGGAGFDTYFAPAPEPAAVLAVAAAGAAGWWGRRRVIRAGGARIMG